MKAHHLTLVCAGSLIVGGALSSCVYYPNPVPEMPYVPRRASMASTATVAAEANLPTPAEPKPATEPQTMETPAYVAPTVGTQADPFPQPLRAETPATPTVLPSPLPPTPAPASTPVVSKPASTITRPSHAEINIAPQPMPVAQPPAPPAAVPAPTPAPAKNPLLMSNPSQITNDGPIPVATRVEGDPTRVYNPLDPSKTIRIIDKNGNVFPSGKELKVRGTNYHFYVP